MLCFINALFRSGTPGVNGLPVVQSNSSLKPAKLRLLFDLHCKHIKDELSKPGQLRTPFYIPEYEGLSGLFC